MLLALQSMVCLVSLLAAKNFRVVSFRDFNIEEAKKCTTPRQPLFRYLTIALPLSAFMFNVLDAQGLQSRASLSS